MTPEIFLDVFIFDEGHGRQTKSQEEIRTIPEIRQRELDEFN